MDLSLKIDGIYDKRTLERLLSLGIKNLGFDLRPKSFNFIQNYKLIELLEGNDLNISKIFLQIDNEKDFIIKKFLEDLQEIGLSSSSDNLVLEFHNEVDQKFCGQFKTPYILHYDEELINIIPCENLFGISLSSLLLEKKVENNEFNSFINTLNTLFHRQLKESNFHFFLNADWDSELYPSYFKFLPLRYFSFQINSKVEVCYRNVNLNKIGPFVSQLPFNFK